MPDRHPTTGLPHIPLVIHVSIRVTTLADTDDGYLWQMCGIPDQDDQCEELSGMYPRRELYGLFWDAASVIPMHASVECHVLGYKLRWAHRLEALGHAAAEFSLALDRALDDDLRMDNEEDRIARAR